MMKLKTRKWEKAFVTWFDPTSGEGMVALRTGEHIYLHYTAIEGWDKNKYVAPSRKDQKKRIAGLDCKVRIYENLYSQQVLQCELLRTKKNAKQWYKESFGHCPTCGQIVGRRPK